MNLRCIFFLAGALLTAGIAQCADTCTFEGVAVTTGGTPIPNMEIMMMRVQAFRGLAQRTAKTGADGSFSFTGLPCGKYMLTPMGMEMDPTEMSNLTVDLPKQSQLRWKVAGVDPLGPLLYVPDMEPAPTTSPVPADHPAEVPAEKPAETPEAVKAVEEASTQALRREYMEQISPKHLAAFDQAQLADQRKMFVDAAGIYIAGVSEEAMAAAQKSATSHKPSFFRRPQPFPIAGGHYEEHEQENIAAKAKLARAAGLIRERLTPDEAARFEQAPETEKAGLFLHAVAARPEHPKRCSLYGLYISDMGDVYRNSSSNMGAALFRPLEDPSVMEWPRLTAPGRCAILDRWGGRMLQAAQSIDQDGSLENLRSAIQRTGQPIRSPKSLVLEEFGTDGLGKYERAQSVERKLELVRAAYLMQVAWGAENYSM